MKLRVPGDVLEDIGKVIEGGIIDNIMSQKTVSGARIKVNTPTTRELKRKLGLPVLSLIFKNHSFIKGGQGSWKSKVNERKQSVSVEPANAQLKTVSEALQARGYVGWFGISAKTMSAIRARLRQYLKERFK